MLIDHNKNEGYKSSKKTENQKVTKISEKKIRQKIIKINPLTHPNLEDQSESMSLLGGWGKVRNFAVLIAAPRSPITCSRWRYICENTGIQ